MKPKTPPELIPDGDVPSIFEKLSAYADKRGQVEASEANSGSPLWPLMQEASKLAEKWLDTDESFIDELLMKTDLTPMNCGAEVYHLLTTLRAFHAHNPWFKKSGGGILPASVNLTSSGTDYSSSPSMQMWGHP